MDEKLLSCTIVQMSFSVRRLQDQSKKKRTWFRQFFGSVIALRSMKKIVEAIVKKRKEHAKKKARVTALKRALIILVSVLTVLVLLAGVTKALMNIQGMDVTDLIVTAGAELPEDAHGHINILLMGQGDEDHDGKDLTDTIMIASLDPQNTKSAVLLSLPRDLYFLNTEKMGKGRINSMYRDYKGWLQYNQGLDEEEASMEAMKELAAELGRKMQLDIHHIVKVDFIGFVRAVDVLGGVDVQVPYDIVDTEYPDNNYGYETFEIKEGLRHLDGETALKYARSRHTTSDFGRSARQQQILKNLAQKAKDEGVLTDPAAITSLMKIMSENVSTTLTLREIISLAGEVKDINTDRIITMQLNDRNALYDSYIEPGGFLYTPPRDEFGGASVLLPVSIPEFPVTWKQIVTLKSLLVDMRSPHLAEPRIAVLNAGAAPGSAGRLSNELIRYGFNVTATENANMEKIDTTLIATSNTDDTELLEFFAALLEILPQNMPENLPEEQREQLTIIIGRDFQYLPLQNLLIPTE